MQLVWTGYGIPPLVTGVIVLATAVYAWRQRATSVGVPFVSLQCAIAVWVVGYGLEILAMDLASMVWFSKLEYLGIASIAPATLAVALAATGRSHHLTLPKISAAVAVPVAVAGLAISNEMHGLVWESTRVDSSGPFPALAIRHGPAYFALVVYSNLCLVAAASLLIRKYTSSWHAYRGEAALVLTGFAVPWIANALYVANIEIVPNLDPTPFAFAVTGLALSAGLHRGVLNVVRVARNGIVEDLSDGVVVVDARDRLIDINAAARRILDLGQPRGATTVSLALVEHPELVEFIVDRANSRGEYSLVRDSGRTIYELEISPVVDRARKVSSRVLVLRDVTSQRVASAALYESEVRHRTLVETVPISIGELDLNGRFTTLNAAGLDMAGLPNTESIRGIAYLDCIVESDRPRVRALFERALRGEACEYEVRSIGNPVPRDLASSFIPVLDDDGVVTKLISHSQDLTERKAAERRIRSLAYYDDLTGLPNRQRFQTQLERSLQSSHARGKRLALLFLDLDGFKKVNDGLGHGVGDQLLCEVSRRFEQSVRQSDVIARTESDSRNPGTERQADPPSPLPQLSRLGGDEFTVLVSNLDDPLDASIVARRVLDTLREPVVFGANEVYTSASIGISIYPDDGTDAETLLRNADTAMYEAKRRGRNTFQFYTTSMNEAGARKLDLEARLRRAIERGDLEIHYQPVRRCSGAELVGAEALVRWTDPKWGNVSPDEFIPIAEECGLIGTLGETVLRTACAQSAAWEAAGYGALRIAVNISGRQIQFGSLVETVARTLAETGLSPGRLELELTESTIMDDDELTHGVLEALSAMGVGLALDDFGTGYSSLSYLRRFRLDRLKIDRSFVGEIPGNADDCSLTAAIIAMAHSLRLSVVAEGVETLDQHEFLRQHGCDEVQGYLFGHPLPAADFERFLTKEKEEGRGATS